MSNSMTSGGPQAPSASSCSPACRSSSSSSAVLFRLIVCWRRDETLLAAPDHLRAALRRGFALSGAANFDCRADVVFERAISALSAALAFAALVPGIHRQPGLDASDTGYLDGGGVHRSDRDTTRRLRRLRHQPVKA